MLGAFEFPLGEGHGTAGEGGDAAVVAVVVVAAAVVVVAAGVDAAPLSWARHDVASTLNERPAKASTTVPKTFIAASLVCARVSGPGALAVHLGEERLEEAELPCLPNCLGPRRHPELAVDRLRMAVNRVTG